MGNYHAPFGKRTMEKGLRQQVPRQRPTSLDGRELETERHGQGHRSGTTRRETAGTKASGPTATPTATAPAPDPTKPQSPQLVVLKG